MSNFANPELDNYFRRIILPSNTAAFPSIVFANDLTVGLYWDPDGIHLTGLADPVDPSEAATKDYVDSQIAGSGVNFIHSDANPDISGNVQFVSGTGITLSQVGQAITINASGGSGATTALDNLAAVAINTALLPGVDGTIDVGSSTFGFRDLYLTRKALAGTGTTGGYGFQGDPDTAFMWRAADVLSLLLGGSQKVRFDGSSNILQADLVIQPITTNTFDFGTTTRRYKDAYLSGSLSLIDNAFIYLSTTQDTSIQYASGTTSIEIVLAGSPEVSITTAGVNPGSDDTYDLGDPSLRWHRLCLSGDLKMTSGSNIVLNDETTATINAGTTTMFIGSGSIVEIDCNSAQSAQFDNSSTAGNTRFLLWDVDSGTLQRVKVTANNAVLGVTGRVLYIDNM